MRAMVWGLSHASEITGCSCAKSATHAFGWFVGRAKLFVRFCAENTSNGGEIFSARFFPAGRRCGIQNSKLSMPLPAGGSWRGDLATARLNFCVTASTPVTRWSLK